MVGVPSDPDLWGLLTSLGEGVNDSAEIFAVAMERAKPAFVLALVTIDPETNEEKCCMMGGGPGGQIGMAGLFTMVRDALDAALAKQEADAPETSKH